LSYDLSYESSDHNFVFECTKNTKTVALGPKMLCTSDI